MTGENCLLDVYIISDATGRTAELVMQAALIQFPDLVPCVRKFQNVRSKEGIQKILSQTEKGKGIVIYSLVSKKLRSFIQSEGRKQDLILFDLLGPLIGKVHRILKLLPILEPGLLKHAQEEEPRLAEAIHFTLKHDDGLGVETMADADLIILGVSRTSKTPCSIYLSCIYGLKVANVPIILGMDIPGEIYRNQIRKVGFTMDPDCLSAIREKRIKELPDYTDTKKIFQELEYSYQIFRRLPGIKVIDVTNLSVEEISDKIMK